MLSNSKLSSFSLFLSSFALISEQLLTLKQTSKLFSIFESFVCIEVEDFSEQKFSFHFKKLFNNN